MSLNENWQNQVENELRNLKDYSIAQSINQLALQSQLNYELPSRAESQADPKTTGELIWIRVTSKASDGAGQIYYSWRRQIKQFTGAGYVWVDNGDSGTVDYYPATGLNNEDVSITDGTRYPAKWNPNTSQWIFFLKQRCSAPSDPGWPVSLFGFGGIMEFVYLDQVDENGNYYINPSVPDKTPLKHIQDWKVAGMTGDDGNYYRVRGYSGWYFQASASTSDLDVNATANDEMDVTMGRTDWFDFVMWWANKPSGYAVPPQNASLKFYGVEHLFMGLTEFGGHYFVSNGYNPPEGPPGKIVFDRYPGPIRMSYLYGPHGDSTDHKIYHTMKFELLSKCTAELTGNAPTIENWGNSGSLIPSGKKVKISPGSDTLLVIDGQRGIRIRTNGWHAHFGDHIFKNQVTREYRWGGNIEWVVALGFSPVEGEPVQGTALWSIDPETGATLYGSTIQLAGYHHWYLQQWCDNNPGRMDRYNIQVKGSMWYRRSTPPSPNVWSNPDPHRVVRGTYDLPVADEVVYSQAGIFKTMHEPPDPLFNVEASYADSIGVSLNFSETSQHWQYLHIEFFSGTTLIGSKFLKFTISGSFNTVSYEEQIPWKRATGGGGHWSGGYPGTGEWIPDNSESGAPEFANEGNMLCLPFGNRISSVLPTCGFQITTIGSAGVAFTVVPYSTRKTTGVNSVTIYWGDGSSSTATIDLSISHTWADAGVYAVSVVVGHMDGTTDQSGTYVTVE